MSFMENTPTAQGWRSVRFDGPSRNFLPRSYPHQAGNLRDLGLWAAFPVEEPPVFGS